MSKPLFIAGDMNQNFRALLLHFGLLSSIDATDKEVKLAEARVKELIPSFSLSRNGMEATKIDVGEGKYKSALLLLFLADGKKKFHRSTTERQLTEMFFTPKIISDAKNPELDNHSVVRALLADGSLSIEIESRFSSEWTTSSKRKTPR
jgi:hypothetical protein